MFCFDTRKGVNITNPTPQIKTFISWRNKNERTKTHSVFEFAFEDAPELMNEKYYLIKLDLMLRPEEDFVVRTYCRT